MQAEAMQVYASFAHDAIPTEAKVLRASVEEKVSELFEIRVELIAPDPDLDLKAMLWSTGLLRLEGAPGDPTPPRCFHGVIEEASYLGGEGGHHRYRLWLRPTLAGLRYRIRTRIFQEQSAPEILARVFEEAGLPSRDLVWDLQAECPKRTYCTQWKESELAFARRLLEEEGIFFFFEHDETGHSLRLADHGGVHTPIPGDDVLFVSATDEGEGLGAVWDLVYEQRLTHDSYHARDWNWHTPLAPVDGAAPGETELRERYEFPGGFESPSLGDRRAMDRVRAANRERRTLRGRYSGDNLRVGCTFSLPEAHPSALAGDYLLLSVSHRYEGHSEGGECAPYGELSARFAAVPADTELRPDRSTPRPRAWGLESAVVTGPAGEEIHTDEHGRVKVRFYWDREGPVDETSSCWIRVQQPNIDGSLFLPRLGWELHVAFLHGDPDRPVALHKAYNMETLPPYGQPGNKTQSALQSATSPGGGSTNEIRLEDGSGGMQWSLHASRDLNVVVAHDQSETVGANSRESVGGLSSAQVGGDESVRVGGSQSASVIGGVACQVAGSEQVVIGGTDSWGVKGPFAMNTVGDRSETIGGLMNVLANKVDESVNGSHTRDVGAVMSLLSATEIAETVGGNKTESVGAAKAVIAAANVEQSAGGLVTLTSGAATFKAGKDIQYGAKGAFALTAAGLIEIKCGEGFMLKGAQVRVTSASATLKGGGSKLSLGGSVTLDAKKFGGKGGPMLTVKGNIDYK